MDVYVWCKIIKNMHGNFNTVFLTNKKKRKMGNGLERVQWGSQLYLKWVFFLKINEV